MIAPLNAQMTRLSVRLIAPYSEERRKSEITRLRQDKYVSMESIEKICFALDCKVDDVLEFNRNEG